MKRFKYNGLMFIAFVLLLIWALSSLVLLDQVTIETAKVPPETKKNQGAYSYGDGICGDASDFAGF